jgi:hypothetical protein
LKNEEAELCLDTLQQDEKEIISVGVFSCQSGGSSAQFFSLSNEGALRREITCASAKVDSNKQSGTVIMLPCNVNDPKWTYDKKVVS